MMPTEHFEDLRDFCAAVTIAKALLSEGLITLPEYQNIKNKFMKLYDPPIKLAGDEPTTFQPQKA